eukprot:353670-Chlamydomonas_euryale.AAC.1
MLIRGAKPGSGFVPQNFGGGSASQRIKITRSGPGQLIMRGSQTPNLCPLCPEGSRKPCARSPSVPRRFQEAVCKIALCAQKVAGSRVQDRPLCPE